MTVTFTESVVEEAALGWLAELGYTVLSGPSIAPGELAAERAGYEEVILAGPGGVSSVTLCESTS